MLLRASWLSSSAVRGATSEGEEGKGGTEGEITAEGICDDSDVTDGVDGMNGTGDIEGSEGGADGFDFAWRRAEVRGGVGGREGNGSLVERE